MFALNQLIGFGSGPADGAPLGTVTSISHTASPVDTTNATTYTFSTQAIGSAASDRIVVVCVDGKATAARTVSSITFGGAGASTAVAYADNATSFAGTGIYYLLVTSGTTATIEVTFSGAMTSAGLGVYAVYGATSTAPALTSSDTNTGTAISCGTINAASSDAIIATAVSNNATAPRTFTWDSPIVEDYDETVETNFTHSGANVILSGSLSAATTTASASVTWRACAAVWR